MTSYHGGKCLQGRNYAEIITEEAIDIAVNEGFEIKGYCEPFCGMLGVYRHIPDLFKNACYDIKYHAGDVSRSVIMMWQAAQKGWVPPTKPVPRDEFLDMQGDGKSSEYKGFVGHVHAYMGKYFKPYRSRTEKSLKKDSDRIVKITKNLNTVKFNCDEYTQYSNLSGYVIYCDPPYDRTTAQYYNEDDTIRHFDQSKFYDWVLHMSVKNKVFMSEYDKPPMGCKLIYSKSVRTSGKNKVESIYLIN